MSLHRDYVHSIFDLSIHAAHNWSCFDSCWTRGRYWMLATGTLWHGIDRLVRVLPLEKEIANSCVVGGLEIFDS